MTVHTAIASLINPGLLDTDAKYAGIAVGWWAIPIGIALILGTAVVVQLIRTKGDYDRSIVIVAVFVLATLASTLAVAASDDSVISENRRDAEASYSQSVQVWLEDGFGISADEDVIADLIGGGSVVATPYDGAAVNVSLSHTTEGELAVLDENRAPIAPTTAG